MGDIIRCFGAGMGGGVYEDFVKVADKDIVVLEPLSCLTSFFH